MKELKSWQNFNEKLLQEEVCKLNQQNLGKDKDVMPQIENVDDFANDLRHHGIEALKSRLHVLELKPSQSTIELDKVRNLMKIPSKELSEGKPIIVASGNVICDGTHRWFTLKYLDKHAKINVLLIDLDPETLIKMMKRYNSNLES